MDDETTPEILTIWNEAKAYIEQGNFEKAIEIYKYMLIRYGGNSVAVEHANAYLGDIYLTIKQPDLAEIYIKKAIGCNSKKPDYHYMLGFLYSTQNQWEKAIREFESAIENNPHNAECLRGLGWAEFNAGNRFKGIAYLKKAQELEPSNVNVLLDLANAYLLNLNFDEAKQYAQEALHLDPGNVLARQVFDKICQFQRDYGRATNQ
jgi:pentatricopeptide repeat protein